MTIRLIFVTVTEQRNGHAFAERLEEPKSELRWLKSAQVILPAWKSLSCFSLGAIFAIHPS